VDACAVVDRASDHFAQAQPLSVWHVSVSAMHESPHGLPVVQTLQQPSLLHAQPLGLLHVSVSAMHASPHALPVLQTLQQPSGRVGLDFLLSQPASSSATTTSQRI
jgi:hypothetical protein